MKTSIVIPTKDKLSRLGLVLQAMDSQINDDVEVICVFDGCKKSTIEEFKKLSFSFKPVVIISDKNVGRATARNLGIKKAKGDLIIFLDDDRIPSSDFVQRHIQGHIGNPKCIVLGKRMNLILTENELKEIFNEKKLKNNTAFLESIAFEAENAGWLRIILEKMVKWLHFYTGNVSLEKKYIEEAGYFDENFKKWGQEDIELGIRLSKFKLKYIVDSKAVNYHIIHESNFVNKKEESVSNLQYMMTKYKDRLFLYLFLKVNCFLIKLSGINDYSYSNLKSDDKVSMRN